MRLREPACWSWKTPTSNRFIAWPTNRKRSHDRNQPRLHPAPLRAARSDRDGSRHARLRTENPCVGGSIPSLAIRFFSHLQTPLLSPTPNVPFIVPLTLQNAPTSR